MSESVTVARFRRPMWLIGVGLVLEALSLLALKRPAGFLTFALGAGTLIGLGMLDYLWRLRPTSGTSQKTIQ